MTDIDLKTRLDTILKRGVAEIRIGRTGAIAPDSLLGEEFCTVYEIWMHQRALNGDIFAKSLGYTIKKDQKEI